MKNKEIRSTAGLPEIDGNTVCGYAAVYNSMSEDLGGFREIIRPGAFDRCLASHPDIRALVDHDSSKILGRTKPGTAKVWSDQRGLRYQITLPDTQTARDLKTSLSRGDIDGSSFAFQVNGDAGETWNRANDGIVRELRDMDVFDVSVVTYPAYQATDASLRGLNSLTQTEKATLEAAQKAENEADEFLRLRQRQIEIEITL